MSGPLLEVYVLEANYFGDVGSQNAKECAMVEDEGEGSLCDGVGGVEDEPSVQFPSRRCERFF